MPDTGRTQCVPFCCPNSGEKKVRSRSKANTPLLTDAMISRLSILIVSCLIWHCMLFPMAATAQEAAKTVRLDGTVYLPEIKLTRTVTPVTKFLFLGAFEGNIGTGRLQKPLCTIDSKNNTILIESCEKLLPGSRTRVVTQNGADSFLDTIQWNRDGRHGCPIKRQKAQADFDAERFGGHRFRLQRHLVSSDILSGSRGHAQGFGL